MEDRNWEDTYRTGSTHPPKKHRGVLALLLIPVILISGFIGLMAGLQLRQPRSEEIPAPVEFSNQGGSDLPTMGVEDAATAGKRFSLGFTGEDVSDLWQNYYSIPQGVLVTQADEATGLSRGDVLLFLGEERITGVEQLTHLLSSSKEKPLKFVIYRGGVRQTLILGK